MYMYMYTYTYTYVYTSEARQGEPTHTNRDH